MSPGSDMTHRTPCNVNVLLCLDDRWSETFRIGSVVRKSPDLRTYILHSTDFSWLQNRQLNWLSSFSLSFFTGFLLTFRLPCFGYWVMGFCKLYLKLTMAIRRKKAMRAEGILIRHPLLGLWRRIVAAMPWLLKNASTLQAEKLEEKDNDRDEDTKEGVNFNYIFFNLYYKSKRL